jgi:hypothetical protein
VQAARYRFGEEAMSYFLHVLERGGPLGEALLRDWAGDLAAHPKFIVLAPRGTNRETVGRFEDGLAHNMDEPLAHAIHGFLTSRRHGMCILADPDFRSDMPFFKNARYPSWTTRDRDICWVGWNRVLATEEDTFGFLRYPPDFPSTSGCSWTCRRPCFDGLRALAGWMTMTSAPW